MLGEKPSPLKIYEWVQRAFCFLAGHPGAGLQTGPPAPRPTAEAFAGRPANLEPAPRGPAGAGTGTCAAADACRRVRSCP
jgi:hypothetical protein